MKKFELKINNENIKSTIESNVLDRNKKLEILAKMLLGLKDNTIISIDGQWGSGKTMFIKQFEYIIKNKYIPKNIDESVLNELSDSSIVIYYNAWENDNHSNVLASITYKILNDFPKLKHQGIDKESTNKVILGYATDIIKIVTNNTLDISNLKKIDTYKKLTDEIITEEEKINKFNELINQLLGNNKRLILIIDELDRCKPTFAVNLLEVIKHFYINDKITILVSTNNKELAHTIKKFYGNDFDGYGYLNRFYDCIYSLDVLKEELVNYLEYKEQFKINNTFFYRFSYILFIKYNFSLRDCDKFCTLCDMLGGYISNDKFFVNKYKEIACSRFLLPIALVWKIKNIDLYNDFINGKAWNDIEKIIDEYIYGTENAASLQHMICSNNDISYKDVLYDTYNEFFFIKDYKLSLLDVLSMLSVNIEF